MQTGVPAAPPRRPLHFDTAAGLIADIDAVGCLATSGRWTFGQSLNHLATWVDYCYDGRPMKLPLPVRFVMRLMKGPILYRPMRAGSRIPKVPGGTLATDVVPAADALAHARQLFAGCGTRPPPGRTWPSAR